MDYGTTYLVLAIIFGLFMAWGIGANDVANAMATSVGSKAITIKQAVIIAAIFEFAGAILAGGQVTSTIRKGIVGVSDLGASPEGAGIWYACGIISSRHMAIDCIL
ncbi:inorganic phosphate transporter [uncultured Cycloclasticus sp.]|uniref:inorganic phosphate transporter n=1 Tax=uncultured Cycloclasticus sp. TaxID=172194 RepID=UPI00258579D5|nr:inorganic phosphate transporter [uncultured Cycloclasticus sp.]